MSEKRMRVWGETHSLGRVQTVVLQDLLATWCGHDSKTNLSGGYAHPLFLVALGTFMWLSVHCLTPSRTVSSLKCRKLSLGLTQH